MRCQRAVLQKPTRKLPKKGFPLAPSWCHPPEGRAQAPWSPPCPKPPAQSPPLPALAAGRSLSSCWGRGGRRFTASAFSPRGSLRELRAVEALAIFARCLQSSSRAELSSRSLPAQPWGPGRGRSVLGQSSSSVSSSQAAWLFLAVVRGVAFLLLFSALGAAQHIERAQLSPLVPSLLHVGEQPERFLALALQEGAGSEAS